jgi:uncharacterized protein YdiU (UPF0061 family)
MKNIPFDNTYLNLPESFYRPVTPEPMPTGQIIAFNSELADHLGIDNDDLGQLTEVYAKANLPDNAASIALAYAGHQFGGFSPQLGDGRALLIGELVDDAGKRFDLHFKGSGRTPFSRGGDGKSPLGPVLREYIVSEAMHRLGVPTTRALCAAATGEDVYRESILTGGMFTRVAASHIRIGTFEYFAARGDVAALQILLEYTNKRHFLRNEDNDPVLFLENYAQRLAELVAKWMSLGFIHGVMNTDNMAISGETIDFGPCAFIDDFAFEKVFSSIDRNGRYAYKNQPIIAQWNLARLADCLSLIIGEKGFQHAPGLLAVVESFPNRYEREWLEVMKPKLGFTSGANSEATQSEQRLIEEWLEILARHRLDFTLSFRALSQQLDPAVPSNLPQDCADFLGRWRSHIASHADNLDAVADRMNQVNPVYIPRNHQVEKVIAAGYRGDFEPFYKLHKILQSPFQDQPDGAGFEKPPLPSEKIEATFCGT